MRWTLPDLLKRLRGAAPTADAPPAAVPEGLCVYAIGDVHGERRCLDRMLAAIAADGAPGGRGAGLQPILVFLGDYVDRGPDSRGVLDRLCELAAAAAAGAGPSCRFLLGNHESAMLGFLAEPAAHANWLEFGGMETLLSYGVRAPLGLGGPARLAALRDGLAAALPEAHRRLLAGLERMAEVGDYVFVHAGIRPGVPLDRQAEEDLLWIREPFLSATRHHGKCVVHGHTIVERPALLPNRIAVDTGAYATGLLTAVALHGTERRIIQTGP
ncbi:MAG TPA: metallophosphoesterase family protein [Alphaproteobacteria bacterium]|nr:metallophosphoesterase family protein [Alphaproteobacteria bacterium]